MKDITLLLICLTVFGIIIALSILSESSYSKKCTSQGGVVIDGYLSQNCWANGGFIEIK